MQKYMDSILQKAKASRNTWIQSCAIMYAESIRTTWIQSYNSPQNQAEIRGLNPTCNTSSLAEIRGFSPAQNAESTRNTWIQSKYDPQNQAEIRKKK